MMPAPIRAPIQFVTALTLLVTACWNTTGPRATNYRLTSIAGLSLPAPYAPNPNFNARIFSSHLSLREKGRGTWSYTTETEVNGPYTFVSTEFSWEQKGLTLTIQLDCADMASTAACIAGPHLVGFVQLGRLTFETSSVIRVPIVFETGGVD